MEISKITHPYYREWLPNWQKWRDVYAGGDLFIERYLKKFSRREKEPDFQLRKSVSYIPSFAKSSVNEIKNSIFSRLGDVTRTGGPQSYQDAVVGSKGGVDLLGSSMITFIGKFVLPELLTMARVGIFVDMPQLSGLTLADNKNVRPYIYYYCAEDIRSWSLNDQSEDSEFRSLLLRDYVDVVDESTGLPTGREIRYRYMYVGDDNKVHVQFFSEENKQVNQVGAETEEEVILNISRIPFVLVGLSDSLLADVASYQICHLNIASGDVSYTLHSNYPFYTEQYDPRTDSPFMRRPGLEQGGQAADAATGKTDEVRTGPSQGRRYPLGTERPGFIHPSSEPILASIQKQEQLKKEIRLLVHLAVTSLTPTKMASAESKSVDREGLEAGLSYIGLELERAERLVATYWAMYEGSKAATVNYPIEYSLKSEADIQAEIDRLTKLLSIVPSTTYQKEIGKRIAELSVGKKVSAESLAKIKQEVDGAKAYIIDPLTIQNDVAAGLVDLETASEIRGYPKGSVEKAKQDHSDRLARIATSQAPGKGLGDAAARGVPDQSADPNAATKEKAVSRDTTQDPTVVDKTRGNGKQ